MKILIRLVLAHHLRHRTRAILSVLGIAVSVCLVIWIIRGYDAASSGQAKEDAARGRFDVVVSPPPRIAFPKGGQRPPRKPPTPADYINPALIDDLRADPLIAEVDAIINTRVRIKEPAPQVQMGPFGGGVLIGTATKTPPQGLDEGRWLQNDAQKSADEEAVISAGFAGRYGVALNSHIIVAGNGGEARLKVIGVLEGPRRGGARRGPFGPAHLGDVYVRPATAAKINGFEGRHNGAAIALKDADAEDAAEFVEVWRFKTQSVLPPVQIQSLHESGDDPMSGRMMQMIAVQANQATVLGLLAACFIIFITLTAGVRARLRELATLRAMALSRGQLVLMIFFEALLLALLGWALGLLLARGLLHLGTHLAVFLQFFQAGAFADYPLGVFAILVGGGVALLGAFAAAIVPAITAARMRPIDILNGPDETPRRRPPARVVLIGVALIASNLLFVILAHLEPFKTFFSRTYKMGFAPPLLGSVAMIIGLAMITPGVVLLVERVAAPLIARLLRLDPRLLRQQLSSHLGRAVGTTIALSAGLALFTTSLIWGYSMLVPFTPDESLPQMLVSVRPAGLPQEALEDVKKIKGVIGDELLAMAVDQPRLSQATLESAPFASVDASQEHVLIMGVDPQRAFAGSDPVMAFDFIQGDKEEAAHKLARGHYCLVPDHFYTQTGLGMGDKFSVEIPNAPGQQVEYEIAGVVYIPGWNWFTKFAEIRQRAVRALAVIFADYSQVNRDFKLDRISFMWMNADQSVPFQEIQEKLLPIANKYVGITIDIPGAGKTFVREQYIKITEQDDLKSRLFRRANDVIWSLTQLPLLMLIIASLAVFNALFASVRARYWQFGVLRGVGMERSQLFRLILSESLMIFTAAAGLSLLGGTLLAWTGLRLCTFFFYFAGRTPPLTFPLNGLSLGFGIALMLCLLAGLIPAWRAARKEPLGFIQAGRLSA